MNLIQRMFKITDQPEKEGWGEYPFVLRIMLALIPEKKDAVGQIYFRVMLLCFILNVLCISSYWISEIYNAPINFGFFEIKTTGRFVEYFSDTYFNFSLLILFLTVMYFISMILINFRFFKKISLIDPNYSRGLEELESYKGKFLLFLKIKKKQNKILFIASSALCLFPFIVYFIGTAIYSFLNSYDLFNYIHNFHEQSFENLIIFNGLIGYMNICIISLYILNLATFLEIVFFRKIRVPRALE